MTVLCGLPHGFEHLIVALDGTVEDDIMTVEFVKSGLLQQAQGMNRRTAASTETHAALLSTRKSGRGSCFLPACTYCSKRGHLETAC